MISSNKNFQDYLVKKLFNSLSFVKNKIQRIKSQKEQISLELKTQKSVHNLLHSKEKINLEIGAGCKKGTNQWTTLDWNHECDLYWDLNFSLPFPDNSVNKIYSSHVLEHFAYKDIIKLLRDCHRILTPDGQFSVCVPNAQIYLSAYFQPDGFQIEKYILYKPGFNETSKIDYVNYMAYMDGEHKYMFDEENLLIILEKVGFKNVKLRSFEQSIDLEARRLESIYAIAEK